MTSLFWLFWAIRFFEDAEKFRNFEKKNSIWANYNLCKLELRLWKVGSVSIHEFNIYLEMAKQSNDWMWMQNSCMIVKASGDETRGKFIV